MPVTASIRDLRNRFPKIRKLLEKDGEVLLAERGKTKYRLTSHREAPAAPPVPVDYWARLKASQPTPLTVEQAQAVHDENRGDR